MFYWQAEHKINRILSIHNITPSECKTVKRTVSYFVLFSATVVHYATGEVGATGGTPAFHVRFVLTAKNTEKH